MVHGIFSPGKLPGVGFRPLLNPPFFIAFSFHPLV